MGRQQAGMDRSHTLGQRTCDYGEYGSLGCGIRSKMRWRDRYSFQNFHVISLTPASPFTTFPPPKHRSTNHITLQPPNKQQPSEPSPSPFPGKLELGRLCGQESLLKGQKAKARRNDQRTDGRFVATRDRKKLAEQPPKSIGSEGHKTPPGACGFGVARRRGGGEIGGGEE